MGGKRNTTRCSVLSRSPSVITSAKEIMFLPLRVCLSVCPQDNSKKLKTNFGEISGGVRCVTSNSWLDFSDDPDQDADTGIFKRNF